jgi:DNA-binding transcriptional MocR family regulator
MWITDTAHDRSCITDTVPILYERLAQRIAGSIEGGLLRTGERLPSLRAVCEREKVSLMTALAAYRRLEALGLVVARPRSGYVVSASSAPPLKGPAIRRARLSKHSTERDAVVAEVLSACTDSSLVPLGLGSPSADLLPLGSLRRMLRRLDVTHPALWASYSPAPGNTELRRLIAQRLRSRGLDVSADEVLLTAGATEGLALSLRAYLRPGDIVAVECPTYFGVLDAARSAGAQVVELPGDAQRGVDPSRLAAALKRHDVRAVVLIPSFANPTGSLMPPAQRRTWTEVLKRHAVALVEDDIFGELPYDGRKIAPMMTFADDATPSFLVGSLCKTLLPGGRLGYVVARSPWIERVSDLKQMTTLANATVPEHLASEYLSSGKYDRHLRTLVRRFELSVRGIEEEVARRFPPGTRVSHPKGGFLVWVELPENCDALRLFGAARREGISIVPGCVFTLGGGLGRFIRLNGAAGTVPRDALARLGRLAAKALLS